MSDYAICIVLMELFVIGEAICELIYHMAGTL